MRVPMGATSLQALEHESSDRVSPSTPVATTRERLLTAARDLFQSRGFHAVGVADILAAAAAPKGSLYHHFPGGKDDLGAEAVARIAADVTDYIAVRAAAGDTGAVIIGQIADMSARRMEKEAFGWSPLIAAVASQAGADTPRLAAAVAQAYADWQAGLETVFARENLEPAQARDAARLSVMALEGAVVLARVEQDGAALRSVAGLVGWFVTTGS